MLTYENQIKIVLDGIEKLIEHEFNIPVLPEHKGTESIVINPVGDTLIEYLASGQTRNYDINVIYTMVQAGGFELIKAHLTNRGERIKRLLFNNSNYSPGGTYKWHDGEVVTIFYEQDEENLDLWRANISFNCTITEVV